MALKINDSDLIVTSYRDRQSVEVKVEHRPTGIVARSSLKESFYRNKLACIEQIKLEIDRRIKGAVSEYNR